MLAKDQTLGKYKILDRLGSGGFGAVYLALDTWVNRKVALKVPHQQSEEVVDLLKEPRIMALLKHPNIVELITVERKNGIFFMVLEYVEGESLDRMIRRERSLAPPKALAMGIDICTALAFAHGHRIIHRDLRPANILVNKEGIAKVTDFGTSRELQTFEMAKTRIGSPPYMAPEHFRGRAVFQSDLWSLGITLYEMLTGTVPFYDADPLKIAQAFSTQPVVPPHLRNPAVPKPFSEVVMKALSINLGDRYLSAQSMLEALQKLRDSVARDTRPMGTAVLATSSSGPHPTYRATAQAATQKAMCRFCYKPLPRMTTKCPSCGEQN